MIERLSAVDGRIFSDEKKKEFLQDKRKFWDWTTHILNGGEIGCFLSHRAFWKIMIDENLSESFVIEDDMEISPLIVKFLSDTHWIPEDASFVKLDYFPVNEQSNFSISRPVLMFGGRKIVHSVGRTYGTGCYVISRAAAEACLKASEKFCLPVDLFMFDARYRALR